MSSSQPIICVTKRTHQVFRRTLDEYLVGLPFNPVTINMKAGDLRKIAVKASKRRAPGLDGWTISELSYLPTAAWAALIRLLHKGADSAFKSLLAVVRRVPLDKGKTPGGVPGPEGYRPVDVFSGVIRIVSSTQIALVKAWLLQSLDEGQFAMQSGTQAVASRAALYVDRMVSLKMPLLGCSLDFSSLKIQLQAQRLSGQMNRTYPC